MKAVLALALVAISFQAKANQEEAALLQASTEVPRVEQLIGSDLRIAGTYMSDYVNGKNIIRPVDDDQNVASALDHFKFVDLNKDGINDLAVIVETKPKTNADGNMEPGVRSLRIYLGDRNGNFSLFRRNPNIVFKSNEGGMDGDPLGTLEVSSKGTISIVNAGGSADKWAYTQKFQIRNGEMYLVGQTATTTEPPMFKTVDTNLITGQQLKTSYNMDSDKSVNGPMTRIPVKPLVKFVDAKPTF